MSTTERLYYLDPYLRSFEAQVTRIEGDRVYLNRTAFYPASGGQPSDNGRISGIEVKDVIDEGDVIAHVVAGHVAGKNVACEIDWTRRFDHMQQHSGQHLLSAVLVELFDIHTVSFHLGSAASTIDLAAPAMDGPQLEKAERRANEIVFENRPITISFAPNSADLGLRKESEREGELRIISIEGLDRSACGGTHVRTTAEIGPVAIRKLDRIRGNVRIEFLCGTRAIDRARADYGELSRIARQFSSSLDDAADMVAAQAARFQELEKTYRKLANDAALREGRDLYSATSAGVDGVRKVIRSGRIDDQLRSLAQGFTSNSKAVLIVLCDDPASIFIAASKDAGIHAGETVKAAVSPYGGRGGGSPVLGQGSVPSAEALEKIRTSLS